MTDRGAIEVDGRCRTSVPNVYAIGDVTGKLMLAHTAEAMGVVAAETIGDAETMELNYDMIPRATFCQPQIASFGYSEAQAKEKGYDVKTASFPFSANGKARGMAEGVGFVKIVADAEHNELLGAHLIGPRSRSSCPRSPSPRCGTSPRTRWPATCSRTHAQRGDEGRLSRASPAT